MIDSKDKHPMKSLDKVGAGLFVALGAYLVGIFMLDTFFHISSMTRGFLQGLSVPLGVGVAGFIIVLLEKSRAEARQRKINEIEAKAEKEPEKAKFAWDVASAKLEAYFDRNLAQVNSIFWLAIIAMFMGFGLVIWGVILSMQSTNHNTSWVAAISGIVTEFIAVTFMVIYRSTMSQAKTFVQVLEKINTVGMAVQILDAIPNGAPVKNETRAELVKLLLKSSSTQSLP